jgi:glyceraldehyde-3-phosphate dehydrogenase/erythrose-4-phosphate dehydrogenase
MTIRAGINGFGRIGREYLRYAADSADLTRLVAEADAH